MIKDYKKALIKGFILWIILFFVASIIMSIFGRDSIGIVMVILSPLISIPISHLYLKKYPGLSEGVKLGILWIIESAILDIVVVIYAFKNGWSFYSSWTVWVGYIAVIVATAIVGKFLDKKKKHVGGRHREDSPKEEPKKEDTKSEEHPKEDQLSDEPPPQAEG